MLTPEQFGAVGNGTTDDSAALQACFNATGETIVLNPAKTYAHASVLTIAANGLTVTGGGTLLANNQTSATAQVQLTATNANTITGIVFDRVQPLGTGTTYPMATTSVTATQYLACPEILPKRVYVTSAFTANPGIDQVLLLGTGAALTLPPAARNAQRYSVANQTASAINISASASDHINSAAPPYGLPANTTIDFISDQNSNWYTFTG